MGFAGGHTNLYAYVDNDPLSYTDPDGLEIRINGVYTGPPNAVHLFLRITPENQARWGEFGVSGPDGLRTFTLSAGRSVYPFGGRLVSDVNRGRDRDRFGPNGVRVPIPNGLTEDQFIECLLQLDAAYADDLPYSHYPEAWGGYNSNSYVSGILAAAGVNTQWTQPGGFAPGWWRPVPAGAFGR